MPCVGAVFMYSMLVVAGDSWWRIPLNVCVLCGHTPLQVLLQIDASSRFEMETFEFHNILQTDDFPMCWVSHTFQNQNALKQTKRVLKQHFWTDVQQVGSESTVVWT